jgi:hypothetical protein
MIKRDVVFSLMGMLLGVALSALVATFVSQSLIWLFGLGLLVLGGMVVLSWWAHREARCAMPWTEVGFRLTVFAVLAFSVWLAADYMEGYWLLAGCALLGASQPLFAAPSIVIGAEREDRAARSVAAASEDESAVAKEKSAWVSGGSQANGGFGYVRSSGDFASGQFDQTSKGINHRKSL